MEHKLKARARKLKTIAQKHINRQLQALNRPQNHVAKKITATKVDKSSPLVVLHTRAWVAARSNKKVRPWNFKSQGSSPPESIKSDSNMNVSWNSTEVDDKCLGSKPSSWGPNKGDADWWSSIDSQRKFASQTSSSLSSNAKNEGFIYITWCSIGNSTGRLSSVEVNES